MLLELLLRRGKDKTSDQWVKRKKVRPSFSTSLAFSRPTVSLTVLYNRSSGFFHFSSPLSSEWNVWGAVSRRSGYIRGLLSTDAGG